MIMRVCGRPCSMTWDMTCNLKCMTCHMTCITCHMTCMTCHMTWEIRYNFKLSWWIVRKIRRVSDKTCSVAYHIIWHGMTWHEMACHDITEIKWNKTWDMNFDFLLTYEQVRIVITCHITCMTCHVTWHVTYGIISN